MNELRIVIDIVGIAIEIFIILRAFDLIWKKRKIPMLHTYAYYACVGIIMFFSMLWFSGTIQFYLCMVAAYFLLSFLYEGNSAQRLVYAVMVYCMIAACEIITGMLLAMMLEVPVESTQLDIMNYFQGNLYSKLLKILLITVLGLNIKSKIHTISKRLVAISVVAASSSIIITILILIFAYRVNDQFTMFLIIIATSMLVFSNLFFVTLMERQSEMEATKQRLIFIENQMSTQAKHFDELYAVQNETRKIWHDMNNGMIALSEYIKLHETEKALTYIENLTGQVARLVTVIDTGCPAVDAILKVKIKRAEDNGCTIKYKIRLPEKIYIDEIDIAILIANALDNAIEYYRRTPMAYKTIDLNIMTHNEYMSIKIDNQVVTDIDINNLVTSKRNALYHGYGLENIRSISERYEGDMHVGCQNNVFILSILLKNIKSKTLLTAK